MKKTLIIVAFVATLSMAVAGCRTDGNISVTGDELGTVCRVDLLRWSGREERKLFLSENDNLQVKTTRHSGNIALAIDSTDGYNAYAGNGLNTGMFVIRVHEAGEYTITIAGRDATGSIEFTKLPK